MENRKQISLWRRIASIICVSVAVIAAPLSIGSLWGSAHLTDTDGFVKTLGPLAENNDLQQLVSGQVAESISGHLQIEQRLEAITGDGWLSTVIPADEIASKANEAIKSATLRVVESEDFATTWESALRTSHQKTDLIFNGQSSATLDDAGNLTFKLDEVFAGIVKTLTGFGIPDLPTGDSFDWNLKLIQNDALPTVQKIYLAVDSIGPWAIYLNAAVFIAGILLAPKYLARGLLWLAVATGLSFIALKTLIPDFIQERLLSNVNADLARAIYDQITNGLSTSFIVTAVVAALLGVASIPLIRKRY